MNKFSMISPHSHVHTSKIFAYIKNEVTQWWYFQNWLCELAGLLLKRNNNKIETSVHWKLRKNKRSLDDLAPNITIVICYREMKMNFWVAFQVYPNNFSTSFLGATVLLSNWISSFKSACQEFFVKLVKNNGAIKN